MLVVGGGIAGMTIVIETAEISKHVVLLEKTPTIGGRVAAMFEYFPKLYPPTFWMIGLHFFSLFHLTRGMLAYIFSLKERITI